MATLMLRHCIFGKYTELFAMSHSVPDYELLACWPLNEKDEFRGYCEKSIGHGFARRLARNRTDAKVHAYLPSPDGGATYLRLLPTSHKDHEGRAVDSCFHAVFLDATDLKTVGYNPRELDGCMAERMGSSFVCFANLEDRRVTQGSTSKNGPVELALPFEVNSVPADDFPGKNSSSEIAFNWMNWGWNIWIDSAAIPDTGHEVRMLLRFFQGRTCPVICWDVPKLATGEKWNPADVLTDRKTRMIVVLNGSGGTALGGDNWADWQLIQTGPVKPAPGFEAQRGALSDTGALQTEPLAPQRDVSEPALRASASAAALSKVETPEKTEASTTEVSSEKAEIPAKDEVPAKTEIPAKEDASATEETSAKPAAPAKTEASAMSKPRPPTQTPSSATLRASSETPARKSDVLLPSIPAAINVAQPKESARQEETPAPPQKKIGVLRHFGNPLIVLFFATFFGFGGYYVSTQRSDAVVDGKDKRIQELEIALANEQKSSGGTSVANERAIENLKTQIESLNRIHKGELDQRASEFEALKTSSREIEERLSKKVGDFEAKTKDKDTQIATLKKDLQATSDEKDSVKKNLDDELKKGKELAAERDKLNDALGTSNETVKKKDGELKEIGQKLTDLKGANNNLNKRVGEFELAITSGPGFATRDVESFSSRVEGIKLDLKAAPFDRTNKDFVNEQRKSPFMTALVNGLDKKLNDVDKNLNDLSAELASQLYLRKEIAKYETDARNVHKEINEFVKKLAELTASGPNVTWTAPELVNLPNYSIPCKADLKALMDKVKALTGRQYIKKEMLDKWVAGVKADELYGIVGDIDIAIKDKSAAKLSARIEDLNNWKGAFAFQITHIWDILQSP